MSTRVQPIGKDKDALQGSSFNYLYQIYTYVKNADKSRSGRISGMLLYAKTDEDITPDSDNIIGGNMISVKTLDLSQNFKGIQLQLEKVAGLLAYVNNPIK